ncbi:MAG TPA: hypothetical protein VH141_19720, partial [Pseudonocardia sp.]|nr:hypothetical protein [Pseudonocardia sp.]
MTRWVAGATPLLAIGLVLGLSAPTVPPAPDGTVGMVRPVALLNPLTGVAGGPNGGSGGGSGPGPKPKAASSPSSDSGSSGGSAAPKPDKAKAPSGSADTAPKPGPSSKPDATPVKNNGLADTGTKPARGPAPNDSTAPANNTAPPAAHPGAPPPAARQGAPADPAAAARSVPAKTGQPDQAAAGAPRPPPPAPGASPPLAQPPGNPPHPIPATQTAAAQGPCDAKACTPGLVPATPANPGSDAQQELLCGTGGAACPAPRPAQAAGSGTTSEVSPATWKEAGHTALDGAGMVPGIQEVANGVNAVWYATEGDWANAGISAAGMIPIAGDAAVGARLVAKGAKAV